MRHSVKLLLFIIATTALPGCKPVKVAGYRPGVEARTLVAYKTFSFYKLQLSGNRGPHFAPNLELCKKAIASEMTSRGFKQVDDDGDLSINIGVFLQSNNPSGTKDEIMYMNEPNYTWLDKQEGLGKITAGTITVELVDTKKKEGIWIGAISGAVPASEEAKQKRINSGVSLLFEKFPVKVKSEM